MTTHITRIIGSTLGLMTGGTLLAIGLVHLIENSLSGLM